MHLKLTSPHLVSTIGSHQVDIDPVYTIAKLFKSGRSQAVRLPKTLRFEGEEVIARRFGNGVLLLPVEAPWQLMREALEEFEADFRLERDHPPPQQRKDWPP